MGPQENRRSDESAAPSLAVCVKGVSKSFGAELVLDNVTLALKPRERLAIIGPSGSGKSTLVRCIAGLDPVDSGHILVGGDDVAAGSPGSRQARRRMGFVFQSFNLFPHLSVFENCVLAPVRVAGASRQQAGARAVRLLERVGLAAHAGKHPAQLSGGQQQRAAIARALVMEPEVLIFDEPTSALDPEMVSEVLQVLTELAAEGATMIIVTHELGFARRVADRILFLDGGRVLAEQSPDDLFTAPAHPRVSAYLGAMGASLPEGKRT